MAAPHSFTGSYMAIEDTGKARAHDSRMAHPLKDYARNLQGALEAEGKPSSYMWCLNVVERSLTEIRSRCGVRSEINAEIINAEILVVGRLEWRPRKGG